LAALCNRKVLAPLCYEHSTTGDFFEEWFEQQLVPLLRKGQTVTMDNASFHKEKKLRKILEGTGINLIMLPTYSPDFNPIEKKWANLKRALPDLIPKFDTLQEAILTFLS
jgi:putative transposase